MVIVKINFFNGVLIGFLFYVSFSFGFFLNKMGTFTLIVLIISSVLTSGLCIFIIKYNSKRTPPNKKIYIALYKIGTVVVYSFFLFYFTNSFALYLHETGHAFMALLNNILLFDILIIPLKGGFTTIDVVESSSILSSIVISGGLTIIVILIILLIGLLTSYKRLKSEIFVSIYLALSFNLLLEIDYWNRSLRNKFGDGWDFLTLNPSLDINLMSLVISGVYWTAAIILYSVLLIFLIKQFITWRSTDINTNKLVGEFQQ